MRKSWKKLLKESLTKLLRELSRGISGGTLRGIAEGIPAATSKIISGKFPELLEESRRWMSF